jgi:hypothetical protein
VQAERLERPTVLMVRRRSTVRSVRGLAGSEAISKLVSFLCPCFGTGSGMMLPGAIPIPTAR